METIIGGVLMFIVWSIIKFIGGIIADMANLVLKAPVCRTLTVLFIAVERENARIARLIGVLADLRDIAVLILDIAVLVTDARVEVVALAALDGVVEAK